MDESHWQIKNDTLLSRVGVWRAESHFSEEILRDFRAHEQQARDEEDTVCSLIKAGKAFGRDGVPDRCTEQTGRLQLDVDEVAHKIFI